MLKICFNEKSSKQSDKSTKPLTANRKVCRAELAGSLCDFFFHWTCPCPAVPRSFPPHSISAEKAKQSSNMCTLQDEPNLRSRGVAERYVRLIYYSLELKLFFDVNYQYLKENLYLIPYCYSVSLKVCSLRMSTSKDGLIQN